MPIWADFLAGAIVGLLLGVGVGFAGGWDVALSRGRREGYQQSLKDNAEGFRFPIRPAPVIQLRNVNDRSLPRRGA